MIHAQCSPTKCRNRLGRNPREYRLLYILVTPVFSIALPKSASQSFSETVDSSFADLSEMYSSQDISPEVSRSFEPSWSSGRPPSPQRVTYVLLKSFLEHYFGLCVDAHGNSSRECCCTCFKMQLFYDLNLSYPLSPLAPSLFPSPPLSITPLINAVSFHLFQTHSRNRPCRYAQHPAPHHPRLIPRSSSPVEVEGGGLAIVSGSAQLGFRAAGRAVSTQIIRPPSPPRCAPRS